MHILFVVGKFPELTFILRTVSALAERGHQVTVAARRRGDWRKFQGELPLPKTLKVRYLLPDTDLSDPRRLAALGWGLLKGFFQRPRAVIELWHTCAQQKKAPRATLRQFVGYIPFLFLRADVIQFDFSMTAARYRMLGEILNAPTVVSCRGSDLKRIAHRSHQESQGRIEAIRSASGVHCVSGDLATLVRLLVGREENVWINRPAVPITRILPKTEYSQHQTPVILAVGGLTWVKGFDYLLTALAKLHLMGIDFRAEIAGGGEMRSVLRFSIEDMNLVGVVQLLGEISSNNILQRMRASDIYMVSSHSEGISNAALEAMASGLPVVTTDAGGMAEAVRDGIDGFVVPVRDIAAMTDRITRLLVDPALREQMGRSARARVEAEFSLERQAHVFEEMYASVANHGDIQKTNLL
ncbi:MAG: glycosyltransferase family 4 protein [Anaerolinea sp.]|nr:glycosyltransferase family 4 protein [Anaerolinea sp.]